MLDEQKLFIIHLNSLHIHICLLVGTLSAVTGPSQNIKKLYLLGRQLLKRLRKGLTMLLEAGRFGQFQR